MVLTVSFEAVSEAVMAGRPLESDGGSVTLLCPQNMNYRGYNVRNQEPLIYCLVQKPFRAQGLLGRWAEVQALKHWEPSIFHLQPSFATGPKALVLDSTPLDPAHFLLKLSIILNKALHAAPGKALHDSGEHDNVRASPCDKARRLCGLQHAAAWIWNRV